jgi:hypothetical protein
VTPDNLGVNLGSVKPAPVVIPSQTPIIKKEKRYQIVMNIINGCT